MELRKWALLTIIAADSSSSAYPPAKLADLAKSEPDILHDLTKYEAKERRLAQMANRGWKTGIRRRYAEIIAGGHQSARVDGSVWVQPDTRA